MKHILVILFSLVSFATCGKVKNRYWQDCETLWPPCTQEGQDGSMNTVCSSRHCGSIRVDGCIEIKPGPMFRTTTLEAHNEKRNLVASGGDITNGMTGAADMLAFSYDLGLEYTSICQSNRCLMEHDKCHSTKKFPYVGQNIAKLPFKKTSPTVFKILNKNITRYLTLRWYNSEVGEVDDWGPMIEHFRFGHEYGHLTAFIWAETAYVGCSRSMWNKSDGNFEYHLTCNYAPEGNVETLKIFTKGKACTKCPNNVPCNRKYGSLCGEVDDSAINSGENPYRKQELQAMKNAAHATIYYHYVWYVLFIKTWSVIMY